MTKHKVYGPRNTHSHHYDGQLQSRGAKTATSSRPRAGARSPATLRDRLRDGASSDRPARTSGQGRGRDNRYLPGQALQQRVLATPRGEPLHQEQRDERVREQALADRLRRAGANTDAGNRQSQARL